MFLPTSLSRFPASHSQDIANRRPPYCRLGVADLLLPSPPPAFFAKLAKYFSKSSLGKSLLLLVGVAACLSPSSLLGCLGVLTLGELETAAPFIGVALVLDMLDGRIARMTGTASEFGLQLDSLADVVSFGMAPAVLAYAWGLAPLGRLGWAVGFLFVTAAALRLARFNIQRNTDKRYFVGLPSPAAAAVVMATIFALNQPDAGGYDASLIVPIVISVVPAVLMVTSIRFRSFRNLLQPNGAAAWACTVLGALAIIVGLVLDPGITGLVIAYGYILQAPLGVLTAPIRERLLGSDSVAPRRQRMPSVFLPEPDSDDDDDDGEGEGDTR